MPDHNKNRPSDRIMNLGDHLEELRMRLLFCIAGIIIGMILCLFFGDKIINFIEIPFRAAVGEQIRLKTLAPSEGFLGYMKVCLVSGVIITSPWVFYQLWLFISTGLYSREKKYVNRALPFIIILFIAGALFFLFIVAPLMLKFFVKFNQIKIDATSDFTFANYISFVTTLMLVFGLAFQMPVAIFILNRIGLVSLEQLYYSRRYVLLGVFFLAAVMTPPDPISMIMLGIPLYLLFELGILISYAAEKRKKKRDG